MGAHQGEILQDVARVMNAPAKPETDAGKRARQAAKELLRRYGQEGTTAFRAVRNEGRPPPPPGYAPPPMPGYVPGRDAPPPRTGPYAVPYGAERPMVVGESRRRRAALHAILTGSDVFCRLVRPAVRCTPSHGCQRRGTAVPE